MSAKVVCVKNSTPGCEITAHRKWSVKIFLKDKATRKW